MLKSLKRETRSLHERAQTLKKAARSRLLSCQHRYRRSAEQLQVAGRILYRTYKSKPEWSLAGIYADEAITGTQVKKREDFQRLINDCMNGDVDMVITKSISRFARNTLDTLKYVRMLKDKGVAVFLKKKTSTPLLWTANCSL